jgi:hypothetical protein
VISLEGRLGAGGDHPLFRKVIELGGRDAGLHDSPQLRQHVGHDGVGPAHAVDFRLRLADDHARARPRPLSFASAMPASTADRRSSVTRSGAFSPSIQAKVGRVR